MDDRITDLLDEVSDDGARPLGFDVGDLTARGRAVRRRRRRRTVAAAVPLAIAAGVAVAVMVGDGSAGTGVTPYATDRTTASPTSTPSGTASPGWTGRNTPMSAQDAEVMARCLEVEPAMEGWRFDARLTDRRGSTATFVSDDHTQWRTCTLGAPGDQVSPARPLDTSPVPDPWPTPDAGIAFSDLCAKDGPACSDRLYAGTFPLREGVAGVEVETPQGSPAPVALGVATYVVRFREPGTATSVPPVVATLRAADGEVVTTYDYNELLR